MSGSSAKQLVSETIYRAVRKDIISGRRAPGERLVELELARQYGASQVPVREALTRLEEQGLLHVVKHTGTFVSEITIEEMEELFQQRNLIEKYAVARAVYLLRDEHRDKLRRIYGDMLEAARQDDLETLVDKDIEFHETMIRISGRKMSLRVWNLLDGQIRRFLMISHPKYFNNLMEVALAHQPLLEAMLSGDVRAAQACFQDHILLIWNDIKKLNQGE